MIVGVPEFGLRRSDFFNRGLLVSPSLCVLLPVCNVQASLAGLAAELLDVLSDLTPQFELLVIDDGSLDATSEAAGELARRFPQIRLVRHATRLGRVAAIRSGLARSSGSLVLLRDEACTLDPHDLYKLWRAMGSHHAALGRASDPAQSGQKTWTQRAKVWGLRLPTTVTREANPHGWQLYRRPVAEALAWATSNRRELLTELTRRGHSWIEVELRTMQQPSKSELPHPVRVDAKAGTPRPIVSLRAQHLAQLRAFALGE